MSSERLRDLRGRLKNTNNAGPVVSSCSGEAGNPTTDNITSSTEFLIQTASSAETSKELEKIIPKGVKSEKSSTMRKVTLELQKPPEIRIQEPSKEENEEPRGAQDVAKVDSVICDSGVGLLSIVNTKKWVQRSMSSRISLRREREDKEKRKKLQRMATMPGNWESELSEYKDALANNPEIFSQAEIADTGETRLHLLAREGKVEIFESLLKDDRIHKELVRGLLFPDKLNWHPVMSATKADSGAKELIEILIGFLDTHIKTEEEVQALIGTTTERSHDTIFTLLMKTGPEYEDFAKSRQDLFRLLDNHSDLSLWFPKLIKQLLEPNSCDLNSRSMKEMIDLEANSPIVQFEAILEQKDSDGNNMLMELAKNMKDDALREFLTNTYTSNFVTHSVLLSKNLADQTLLTLIEVNRESLSESLPLVLKKEYGCHRRDIAKTELCLSSQLESSASAAEINKELKELEPKSCCAIFKIWAILFLTSLTLNIGLCALDIISDSYLSIEYWNNYNNASYNKAQVANCTAFNNTQNPELEAYATCLNAESKFFYTITFLLIPLIFYLTEFLTLRDEYEPTGLRSKIVRTYQEICTASSCCARILKVMELIFVLFVTLITLALWQPVTAIFKFYSDGMFESSEGTVKVQWRKSKRYNDLAASRGELIEVCIEAVFEPMVQGYIIFPYIIDIANRLSESVTFKGNNVNISLQLSTVETVQIASIATSIISLAWCFSEYHSVRKNMLLDITVSPLSRIVMFFYMMLQVIARLLAFMLFTLYWGPGNFYPLMIFIVIHMLIAALLHVVFSEDLAFLKQGHYLKFFHNVIMNAFASIYFHNYLRLDEMPSSNKKSPEFIDSQKPGLHISTFLRQLMFDFLYAIEYVVLLTFGLFTNIPDLDPIWTFIIIIIVLALVSVLLRLLYYLVLHVWSNVIFSDRKLVKKELRGEESQDMIQKGFLKYIFVQRNTWILGKLKHIHITLIVLPKEFTESIGRRFEDINHSFQEFIEFLTSSKFGVKSLIISLLSFFAILVVILVNVVVIALLLVGIILAIPVSIALFWYNLKSGFGDEDVENQLDVTDSRIRKQETILELPPEIGSSQLSIFHCYPDQTMVSIEESLRKKDGTLNLKGKTLATPDEFEMLKTFLLSLNKKFSLKVLNLDYCDLTDEKLEKLIPLMIKFQKVTLNGSQKISSQGWDNLGQAIKTSGCKLRKLELKIASKDDDAKMKLRRDILLEEFKPSTMTTHDALQKIASFLPYLEEVHLDDIFNDNKILSELQKYTDVLNLNKSPNNLLLAWQTVAKNILETQGSQFKLQTLSLSGCAINDEIMEALAPALVKIKNVHLGHNPISVQGWQHLEKALKTNDHVALTHLSVKNEQKSNDKMVVGNNAKYLHCQDMEQFAKICVHLEEVDLSGQVEIGHEGWDIFFEKLKEIQNSKLKNLNLKSCKVKSEGLNHLKFAHPGLKLEHDCSLDSTSISGGKWCC